MRRREAVTLDEYERGVEDMVSVAQAIAAEEKRAEEARKWARYKRAGTEDASRRRGGRIRARQEQAEKRARLQA